MHTPPRGDDSVCARQHAHHSMNTLSVVPLCNHCCKQANGFIGVQGREQENIVSCNAPDQTRRCGAVPVIDPSHDDNSTRREREANLSGVESWHVLCSFVNFVRLGVFGGVTVLKLKLISYKKIKITKITKYIYNN